MRSYNKLLVGLSIAMMSVQIYAMSPGREIAIRPFVREHGYHVKYIKETKEIILEHKDTKKVITLPKEQIKIEDGVSYMNQVTLQDLITTQRNEEKPMNDLRHVASQIIEGLIQEDYRGIVKKMDEKMVTQINEVSLQQAWSGVIKLYGAVKSYSIENEQKLEQYMRYEIKLECVKGDVKAITLFNREGQLSGFQILPYQPEVEKPQAVIEKAITLQTGDYAMPGMLMLPSAEGKYPVVILVHGSGPNDKDESVGGTKVFRDIAYGLAKEGIATYRYDKRTYTYLKDVQANIGLFDYEEEVIEDALSAIELMKTLPEIEQEKIYVLGHSLGAMSLPMISTQDEGVAGYMMLAGPARNLVDVVIEQVEYLSNLQDMTAQQRAMYLAQIKLDAAIIKTLTRDEKVKELAFMGINNKVWADLNGYDQVEVAKQMTEPMLIVQGGRDYQVTMKDFRLWEEALADKENVTFKDYPSLNHLLVSGEGISTPEEYYRAAKVDEAFILDLAKWIQEQE